MARSFTWVSQKYVAGVVNWTTLFLGAKSSFTRSVASWDIQGALDRTDTVQPLWYTGVHLPLLPAEQCSQAACVCGWGQGVSPKTIVDVVSPVSALSSFPTEERKESKKDTVPLVHSSAGCGYVGCRAHRVVRGELRKM